MPILRPEIQKALRAAGLTKDTSNRDDVPLADKLSLVGLSLDETLERLADLVNNCQNEVIRRQAIDTTLKLHGVLKEQAPLPPSVTIVINDPNRPTPEVNPILLPREISLQKGIIQ